MAKNNNHKAVSYNKWGYIFLIPFVVVYLIFQLVPLISTIYNSFFENYRSGLTQIGPNFVGFANYVKLFEGGEIWIYFKNTMIMWVMGFIPQILVSLLLGCMVLQSKSPAERTAVLQDCDLSPEPDHGICICNVILHIVRRWRSRSMPCSIHVRNPERSIFLSSAMPGVQERLVAILNFLMWFGNTTILLMAGMMGIDPSTL